MELTIPPEQTTAVTDYILGFLALGMLPVLSRHREDDPVRLILWRTVLGLLAAASFLGGSLHGFVWPPLPWEYLWYITAFLLGFMVSLFAGSVLYEWKGRPLLKPVLTALLVLALLYCVILFSIAQVNPDYFIVFILYSGAAMLLSLAASLIMAWKGEGNSDRAPWMAAAIGTMILASILQALHVGPFTLVWEFDHNSIYHFVMMGALGLLYRGIRGKA